MNPPYDDPDRCALPLDSWRDRRRRGDDLELAGGEELIDQNADSRRALGRTSDKESALRIREDRRPADVDCRALNGDARFVHNRSFHDVALELDLDWPVSSSQDVTGIEERVRRARIVHATVRSHG